MKEWDAATYHEVSTPQQRWGLEVLSRLPLRGDEVVLDAGAGTGRLTAALLERLPQGRVIALDVSKNMLAQAEAFLEPRFHGGVEYVEADLARLSLDGVCDVVFSTATFHWVKDHDALFRGLFRALRPGGRLHAQLGAQGNLDRIHHRAEALLREAPYAQHFEGWVEPYYFPGVEETRARLLAAGFCDPQVSTRLAPTTFPDREALARFLRAVVLRIHLSRLPPELSDAFLNRLLDDAERDEPPLTLDYVRLDVQARKD